MEINKAVYQEAERLMELLIIASGAKTPEAKARICWRANDYLWRTMFKYRGWALPRAFNNLCQDKEWPWVNDLWSKEEIADMMKDYTGAK